MSTLVYAALTTRREEAEPGTSSSTAPPGVKSYVDALAALVPSEVLALHALIISATTTTTQNDPLAAGTVTSVPASTVPSTLLAYSFAGLVTLSVVMYVVPRIKTWGRLDVLRALIPPSAFIAWTMLQRATAFDAIAPGISGPTRTVVGLFIAVILGMVASALAVKADAKLPATAPEAGRGALATGNAAVGSGD